MMSTNDFSVTLSRLASTEAGSEFRAGNALRDETAVARKTHAAGAALILLLCLGVGLHAQTPSLAPLLPPGGDRIQSPLSPSSNALVQVEGIVRTASHQPVPF